jgi:hypothetical protein
MTMPQRGVSFDLSFACKFIAYSFIPASSSRPECSRLFGANTQWRDRATLGRDPSTSRLRLKGRSRFGRDDVREESHHSAAIRTCFARALAL